MDRFAHAQIHKTQVTTRAHNETITTRPREPNIPPPVAKKRLSSAEEQNKIQQAQIEIKKEETQNNTKQTDVKINKRTGENIVDNEKQNDIK